jgi:hypothetical protein
VNRENFIIKEKVPYINIAGMLQGSTILLLLTRERAKGILGTELYEFLGVAKPIICVPDDKGEIKRLLSETGAGCCTSDIFELKKILAEAYKEWKANGYVSYKGDYQKALAYLIGTCFCLPLRNPPGITL